MRNLFSLYMLGTTFRASEFWATPPSRKKLLHRTQLLGKEDPLQLLNDLLEAVLVVLRVRICYLIHDPGKLRVRNLGNLQI